ncbi:hypothetical protein E3J79_03215 [Candidatus Dependentiae bacterium]|nr:MAG: hypothetical protein E3J79_03215 [Candidatus Dependentiae bacterium]
MKKELNRIKWLVIGACILLPCNFIANMESGRIESISAVETMIPPGIQDKIIQLAAEAGKKAGREVIQKALLKRLVAQKSSCNLEKTLRLGKLGMYSIGILGSIGLAGWLWQRRYDLYGAAAIGGFLVGIKNKFGISRLEKGQQEHTCYLKDHTQRLHALAIGQQAIKVRLLGQKQQFVELAQGQIVIGDTMNNFYRLVHRDHTDFTRKFGVIHENHSDFRKRFELLHAGLEVGNYGIHEANEKIDYIAGKMATKENLQLVETGIGVMQKEMGDYFEKANQRFSVIEGLLGFIKKAVSFIRPSLL